MNNQTRITICLVWALVLSSALASDENQSGPDVPSKDEFAPRYTAVMKATARGQRTDAAVVIPEMVGLYQVLPEVEGLSRRQRGYYQAGLRSRLTLERNKLLAAQKRTRRGAEKVNGGGAVGRQATELINLVQATIAPSTWEANGGSATIRYWSRNPALVIRQTGEVHHEIGGTLRQLRRAQ